MTWTVKTRKTAEELEERITRLSRTLSGAHDEASARMRAALRSEEQSLKDKLHKIESLEASRIPLWVNDDAINAAWDDLHDVEESLDAVDPALTSLVWDASQHAERELTKAEQKDFQRRLGKARGDAEQRKIALKTIELAHQVAEDRHAKERKWQRAVTIAAAALVTAAAVVVAWAAALGGDAFLPMPADATMSAWQFLLLVMGFGMVGGLLSGTVHLYLDKGPTSGNVWWDARPALTLVKVACGVWTAWVGVVAITSAADSLYNSVPAVLLLALMFGYCQEAVTHYLDQKAGAILTPETAAAAKDNKDRTKLRTARTAIKSRTATTRRTTR